MAHLVIDNTNKVIAASESAYPASVVEFYQQQGCTIENAPYERGYDGQLYRAGEAPQKSPEEQQAEAQAAMQAEFTNAIQQRLDAFAQERGYDNIMSACSYFGSGNARFKAEADRAIQLRDDTWAICYAILAAVLAGERAVPTLEEIVSELPALTWEDAAEAQPVEEPAVTEEPDVPVEPEAVEEPGEAADPEGADVPAE